MLSVNLGLYVWDILRYLGHQPPSKTDSLALGIPRQTEGLAGLVDQHMGDLGPTLALIYLSRIPVEVGAKLYEAVSSKKVNPRTKLCLAVLIGMSWPIAGELGFVSLPGVDEPADLFGIAVAGIVVTAGYEAAKFIISKPERYWEDRFVQALEAVKPIAEKLIK